MVPSQSGSDAKLRRRPSQGFGAVPFCRLCGTVSLHQRSELTEIELETDPALLEMRLIAGAFHCMTYEFARDPSRFGQAAAGHHRAAQCGRESVTRTVDHVRQLVVHKLDLLGSALFGARHVVDDLAVTVVDALEHHVLGTESQQRVQQFGHGGVIEILPGVVALGQDARFGQVRHQHVRAVRQSPHRLAQFRRVRRVHLPGVAHNRVDQPQRGRIFAVQALDEMKNTKVEKVSTFITTPPYGVTDQPDFLNGCLKLSTLLYPEELLKELNRIEKEAGRERIIHWGPRTLDLDIIFYDDLVAETDALCIPHVEMHKRAFVLEPLHEIAPYKRHPVYGKTVREMLEDLRK